MNKPRKSRNALGTARALFLSERRRKWHALGPDLRRHKESFVKNRPAGVSSRDAARHWEHIFAGFRESPYAAHWAETALRLHGVDPR